MPDHNQAVACIAAMARALGLEVEQCSCYGGISRDHQTGECYTCFSCDGAGYKFSKPYRYDEDDY